MEIRISRKSLIKWIITISVFLVSGLVMVQTDTWGMEILRFICKVLLILTLYFGVTDQELLNPMLLFSLTPLSLLLYSESVSTKYLNPLSETTWFLGLINMIAFVWIVRCKTRSISLRKTNELERSVDYNAHQRQLLIDHGIVLIAIGLIPDICEIIFGTSFFFGATIRYLLCAGVACAWKSRSKIFIVIAYILWFLSIIWRFNKSIFLNLILVTILSFRHLYAKNDRQKKAVYFWAIGAAMIMLIVAFPLKAFVQGGNQLTWEGISNAITSYFQEGDTLYDTTVDFNGPSVLKLPYMYLVTGWNNFQYVLETQPGYTFGLWLFKPLLSWLQLDGLFARQYYLRPYSSFNTYGYITVLYKDFGMWGSVAESILLGWFVSKVYIKFRSSNSPFDVACYAMTAQATLEMFFSNHFFMQSYPFTIILMCWIYKYVFRTAKNI